MLRHALLILLLIPNLARARAVAMLINFGDEGGKLGDKFAADMDRAREIYARLGYDVIFVPPTEDMHQAVENAFAKVGRADQLAIETMGHGVTDLPPKGLGDRFPTLTHVPSAGAYSDDRADVFHFHNGGRSTNDDFAAALDSPNYAETTVAEQLRHDVGAGDVARLISKFKGENAGAPVRVMLNECYSGHPARTLERLEGVQAYAESNDRVEAHILADDKKTSFANYYLDQLEKAAAQIPRPSAMEVFTQARRLWIDKSKSLVDHVEIPWSPVDALAHDWCAANPGAKPGAQKIGERFPRLKALTDDTLRLERSVDEDQDQRRSCKGTTKVDDLKHAVEQAAQVEKDVLSQMLKLAPENSVLSRALGRGRTCLDQSAAAKCTVDLDLLQTPLPDRFGPPIRGAGPPECQNPEPANLKKCLGTVRGLAPRAAFGTIADVRRDLQMQIGECDRPESRAILKYYDSCYARFWSSADAKTEARLAALEKQMLVPVGASGSRLTEGSSSSAH